MVKVYSPHYSGMSGQIGKSGVHMVRKGVWIMREWLKPTNPNTPDQQNVRSDFANAVSNWHGFNAAKKDAYGYYATSGLASGFNVYVGEYRKAPDQAAKDALEPTEFTTTVTSDGTTPVEGAKVTYKAAGSDVVRYQGTSDTNGEAAGALRADNGKTYDLYVEADGYETYYESGLAPADATTDVTLTAL
ncbi:MAG: carboxypeptidase-like regulatory domain-containing protein [Candidatus Thermoplasmatota archaeon]|nr:carboxypeptidase-like regulatory domain-containing protein [Candidatus Thermoplasmatota archaeon]